MLRFSSKLATGVLLFTLFSCHHACAHNISYSSALLVAASHTIELNRFTGAPAIPLPLNVSAIPNYKAAVQLAADLPIMQQVAHLHLPSAEAIEASMIVSTENPSADASELIARTSTGLNIMIVGDSISQGQQGDYTWRYRLWQWLRQQNIATNFVGPYTGTFRSSTAQAIGVQGPTPPPPLYSASSGTSAETSSISVDGGYALSVDQAFLSNGNWNHATNWGRAMAVDQGLITQWVKTYQPDIILLELGFNDMGWFYSDCYGTITSLDNFINNARSAKSNVKFVVANVPQRTFIRQDLVTNITTYNQLLPPYIAKKTTAQSPIQLAEFQQNYACGTTSCPAGYDGLHPNAWGEYQIAQAFSKSLIQGFGIGTRPITIPAQSDPSLLRNISTPQNFKVFSSPQGVSATWDAVYGAYSYEVDVSINGGGSGFSGGSVQVNRFDSQWPLAGWSYAVNVRAVCGNQVGGNTTTLTATATPQLAPPPNNVKVVPTSGGFTVTWDPPVGPYTSNIVEYNIIYWDTNPSDCEFISGGAFKSSPAVITGLNSGKNYLVAAVTWNENGQGLPVAAHNVVPGSLSTPATPANVVAHSNDATSLHLSWDASAGAAGYEVFWRNATGGPYISLTNVTSTCEDDYFLFPGTWNYQFCVAAWNGNLESSPCKAVIPPRPASTVTPGSSGPTCAPAPPWCPGYGVAYSGPSVGGCAGCGGGGASASTSAKQQTTVTVTATATPSSSKPLSCSTSLKRTVISATPLVICGSTTSQDPSPPYYSFQAQFTGNIAYGDLNPTDLVSSISSQCTNGCNNALSTPTATAQTVSGPHADATQVALYIPYEVTADQVPQGDLGSFLDALTVVVSKSMNSTTFAWQECFLDGDGIRRTCTPQGNVTEHYGPSFVQGTRWSLNSQGVYKTSAGVFTFDVTSYTEEQKITCSEIEGPIAAGLGLIPMVGAVFGFIGASLCSSLSA